MNNNDDDYNSFVDINTLLDNGTNIYKRKCYSSLNNINVRCNNLSNNSRNYDNLLRNSMNMKRSKTCSGNYL